MIKKLKQKGFKVTMFVEEDNLYQLKNLYQGDCKI